jgi:ferredoxin
MATCQIQYSFLNFTIMIVMAHRKQDFRFENDWEEKWLKKGADERWKSLITIPVGIEIEADHTVLNVESAMKYLDQAHTIIVQDCFCRDLRHNCDAPLNVCILLNDKAEYLLEDKETSLIKNRREISKEEAIEILKKAHEAGLVLTAQVTHDFPGAKLKPDEVFTICGCCSCCCCQLSAIIRYGLAPQLLKSHTTSVIDSSKCTYCGVCVDRCQFGARQIVNGSLHFNPDLCFGCGLCVSTCPTSAITLVDK